MARPGLTGHRKFRRLARELGSLIIARGVLELLWESAYESGDEYLGTSDDLETIVGWTGERGVLTRALVEAGMPEGHGFIEVVTDASGSDEPRYRVHDLWHHCPDYVSKRRKRELERRTRSEPVVDVRRTAPNGGQWPPSLDSQAGVVLTPSPSPSPAPSPSTVSAAARGPDTPKKSTRNKLTATHGNASDLRESFEVFWLNYPQKVAKDAAWRAWQKRRPSAELLQQILSALAWQVRQDSWIREAGRYIPNPATWLNAARWEDEPNHTQHVNKQTLALARAGEQFLLEGKS
jgi:hypothetical protein